MTLNPALHAVLVDIDDHVAGAGWDQPVRLFALVQTAELVRAEPTLASALGIAGSDPAALPALTPVEQEGVAQDEPLDRVLARIAWGPAVDGAAIALERVMLPADAEQGAPTDADEGAAYAAAHPHRREVRMMVAVLRDGARDCALRFRSDDRREAMLFGAGLVPALADALAGTLRD